MEQMPPSDQQAAMGRTTDGIVDDDLLSDLMDLDSLSEQLGDDESWMDGSGGSSCDFNLTPYVMSCNGSGSDALQLLQQVLDASASAFPSPLSPSPLDSANIAMMLLDQNDNTMTDDGAEESFLAMPSEDYEDDNHEKFGLSQEEEKLECETETRTRTPVNPPASLRDRLSQVVRCIGRLRVDALVQVWMPKTSGEKRVITTRDQPYYMEQKNDQLWLFRTACEGYEFGTEPGSNAELSLLGRVFVSQMPEWSPNVQMYTRQEYSCYAEAQRCDVRGSLALPVLDPATHLCVAVIQLASRSEKLQYSSDVEIVSRALLAVNLTTVNSLETPIPEVPFFALAGNSCIEGYLVVC